MSFSSLAYLADYKLHEVLRFFLHDEGSNSTDATSQNADILVLLVAVAAREQVSASRRFREVLLQQGRVPAVLTSIKQVRVAAAVNKETLNKTKKQ